jgi:hypothetical protein
MPPKKRSVDALLNSVGKSLQVDESVSIPILKGANPILGGDPVDLKAPRESFPMIAKFPESVVKPEFTQDPWSKNRLYEQDVPKPVDDSDEEQTDAAANKKRWKYARKETPKRQWILQDQVDFLETMVARRQGSVVEDHNTKLSSRYEGLVEANASHYVVLEHDATNNTLRLRPVPTGNATVNFSQPSARKTLTLSQAELAIQDQRNGGIRTLHHVGLAGAAAARAKPVTNNSKNRLLEKLKSTGDDDDDDVMGDVAFRNRKGAGAARKELLTTLGDGLKVGDDGVLGGSNDAAFGGRQKFGAFHAGKQQNSQGGSKQERGADGAAMADDFYQRDVQAEYEEMDYDANELFDDDDVDVGETEVNTDKQGYAEDDTDDDMDEVDVEEEEVAGAAGLASVAGFKHMLAKARGEFSVQAADSQDASSVGGEKKDDAAKLSVSQKPGADAAKNDSGDHIAKIMAAADKAAQAAKNKVVKKPPAVTAIQVDENGLRMITLEAIRREIWLNHGSMPIKRLMKIFDVKKKSTVERQNKFREVVKVSPPFCLLIPGAAAC